MRIDRAERKKLKAAARGNVKRHYPLFVLMCLFATMIGSEFITSDDIISSRKGSIGNAVSNYEEEIIEAGERRIEAFSDDSVFAEAVERTIDRIELPDDEQNSMFSRSKGTLNHVIDIVASGTIISTVTSFLINIASTSDAAEIIVISIGGILIIWFWMFVQMTFSVIMRRVTLEGRLYKNVPLGRFLFIIRNKSWMNTAFTMALLALCDIGALMTVFGLPVVYYGTFMMPFILAENPKIKPAQALKLSWNMTRGHKMELFVNDLTLIGWYILSVLTAGLVGIFYGNPYRISVYTEYYAAMRKEAITTRIPGNELLYDRYLYEKCDLQRLKSAYPEVVNVLGAPAYELVDLSPAKRFFASHFGVVLWNTPDEKRYEENQAARQRLMNLKDEVDGLAYPAKLTPIPEERKRKNLFAIHYMRHYSLLSLVLMFFIYSGFGWVWEVFYYYILQGHYINRGVMHGPWLPIYGAGGLAILIFLFPLRRSPTKHFFATMILCGAIEYLASVVLEYMFHEQWWSYEGFFLNLNGRICAEGLLVFGVAGLAFIYFLSPLLDDRIRRGKPAVLIPIAVVLVTLFVFDFIYSKSNPNTGDGITDNFAGGENAIVLEKEA